jgi:AcrR family transcriptional regulator
MATKKKPPPKPYHDGNLRAGLIEAGEKLLRRGGVAGLGLRAVAREAGVSHTAAKPHFGSLNGLRGAIAAAGYHRLAEQLEVAHQVEPDRARRVAIARAYVRFAHANAALFELMFQRDLLDMTSPALGEATARAMQAIAGPVAAEASSESLSREGAIRIAAGWAFVHGLATLLIEKRLRGVQKRAPTFASLVELTDAVLDSVSLRVEL